MAKADRQTTHAPSWTTKCAQREKDEKNERKKLENPVARKKKTCIKITRKLSHVNAHNHQSKTSTYPIGTREEEGRRPERITLGEKNAVENGKTNTKTKQKKKKKKTSEREHKTKRSVNQSMRFQVIRSISLSRVTSYKATHEYLHYGTMTTPAFLSPWPQQPPTSLLVHRTRELARENTHRERTHVLYVTCRLPVRVCVKRNKQKRREEKRTSKASLTTQARNEKKRKHPGVQRIPFNGLDP